MATIGLIGAGHIGSQIARLAVANGYDVVVRPRSSGKTLLLRVGTRINSRRHLRMMDVRASSAASCRHGGDADRGPVQNVMVA
jgi:3-hydroxyacyl-CoA dehydrogenase